MTAHSEQVPRRSMKSQVPIKAEIDPYAPALRKSVAEEVRAGLRLAAESVLKFHRGDRAQAVEMLRRWKTETGDLRWDAVADLLEQEAAAK